MQTTKQIKEIKSKKSNQLTINTLAQSVTQKQSQENNTRAEENRDQERPQNLTDELKHFNHKKKKALNRQ